MDNETMNIRQLIKSLLYVDSSRNLLAVPSSEVGKEHLNKKVIFKWKVDRPLLEKIDDAAFSESWSDEDDENATFHYNTLFFEFECTDNYGPLNDMTIELKLKDLSVDDFPYSSKYTENKVKKVIEEVRT